MRDFPRPDEVHLQAAVGWLELGNWQEANEELENITPLNRAHPDVLQIRVKIYSAAGKWEHVAEVSNTLCSMLPQLSFGPVHLAYALRQLGRTEQAKAALVAVADKFPDEWRVSYLLACYCCHLGERQKAMAWLEQAIDVAGKTDIRLQALDEPDLKTIWSDISEI